MDEQKCKSMAEIQQLVEDAICERTRADIVNILERIASLKPPERLLLYMRMPSGSPETDPLRQPQNPLGTRSEINHTINWVRSHLEHDSNVSIPKQDVYDDYFSYCTRINIKPLSTADFGKVMKQVFPTIRPRRLGTRGNSRYCYAALRKTTRLTVPSIALAGTSAQSIADSESGGSAAGESSGAGSTSEEDRIIRDWASKVLNIDFSSAKDLAEYITANQLIQSNNNNRNNSRARPPTKPCSKDRVTVDMDDLSASLTKKRRKKTRNSVSTETSRAASPEPHPSTVTIKHEPDMPPVASFPLQSHCSNGLMNTYANGVIMSPLNSKLMKTELLDVDSDDPPPVRLSQLKQVVISKPEEDVSQSQNILCKKVRQAQQTKELYAQRALNLDLPSNDETSLMRPPIINPQLRANIFAAAGGSENLAKRALANCAAASQLNGEKGDVTTDIIIPRERVISICSLDKDALDDYLFGEDNSQDQEAELMKYFQPDENPQNMSVENKPVPMLENYQLSAEPSDDMKSVKRMGYDKTLSELRYYLQQSSVFRAGQSQQMRSSSGPDGKSGDAVVLGGLPLTAQNQIPINSRTLSQQKRDNNSTVTSPCFLADNLQQPNISESNLAQPSIQTNHPNIPHSPNSRRKNFTFVPISPGPQSPSGGVPLNVCGPKQTTFASPKSASQRKSSKNAASASASSVYQNPPQSISGQTYITPQNSVYGVRNNNVAISAPPSPSSMLHQVRHQDHASQMQLADANVNKKSQFDGASTGGQDMIGNRSQSAPIHCQMQNGKPQMYINNATSISLSQSPIGNEYCDYMDMVGSGSNEPIVKLETTSATDLSTSTSNMLSQMYNKLNYTLPLINTSSQDPNQFIGGQNTSRSVPSTPQPQRYFGSSLAGTSSSMAMYDISKSVPTTPLANGFGGTGTPFRYSPSELNRDCLINGNTIETLCDNSMTSTFFTSGQHSLDHTDQQNSNLSERDLRHVNEDIDELTSFGDAADPIIGSDLLNQL